MKYLMIGIFLLFYTHQHLVSMDINDKKTKLGFILISDFYIKNNCHKQVHPGVLFTYCNQKRFKKASPKDSLHHSKNTEKLWTSMSVHDIRSFINDNWK